MKVLINIITPDKVAELQETYPSFNGTITISGQQFIPGEWTHVPDDFVVTGLGSGYIKNVRWVLAHLVRKYLREQNLHQFAQGVKEAAEMYNDTVPTLATTVLTIAPEDEIAE